MPIDTQCTQVLQDQCDQIRTHQNFTSSKDPKLAFQKQHVLNSNRTGKNCKAIVHNKKTLTHLHRDYFFRRNSLIFISGSIFANVLNIFQSWQKQQLQTEIKFIWSNVIDVGVARLNILFNWGSGCGSVGKAVVYGPSSNPVIGKIYIEHLLYWKKRNKEKMPGMAHFSAFYLTWLVAVWMGLYVNRTRLSSVLCCA